MPSGCCGGWRTGLGGSDFEKKTTLRSFMAPFPTHSINPSGNNTSDTLQRPPSALFHHHHSHRGAHKGPTLQRATLEHPARQQQEQRRRLDDPFIHSFILLYFVRPSSGPLTNCIHSHSEAFNQPWSQWIDGTNNSFPISSHSDIPWRGGEKRCLCLSILFVFLV